MSQREPLLIVNCAWYLSGHIVLQCTSFKRLQAMLYTVILPHLTPVSQTLIPENCRKIITVLQYYSTITIIIYNTAWIRKRPVWTKDKNNDCRHCQSVIIENRATEPPKKPKGNFFTVTALIVLLKYTKTKHYITYIYGMCVHMPISKITGSL